jgi:hypothetical protein
MTEARIIPPTQYQEIGYIESGSAQRVKLRPHTSLGDFCQQKPGRTVSRANGF